MHAVLAQPFVIMGIVNVTPDSFFDGGEICRGRRGNRNARALAAQGAHILDSGESPRGRARGR